MARNVANQDDWSAEGTSWQMSAETGSRSR